MRLAYRWTKRANGALDAEFVAPLASHFGLSAFVETGTYLGDTLASMAGVFSRMISIELSPALAEAAAKRFAAMPAVTILCDDSTNGLGSAFDRLQRAPAFIWLDAHYSGGPTAKGVGNTPILNEVEQILDRREGHDVVLIDDARLFWPVPDGFLDHDTLAGYPLLSDVATMFSASRHGYKVFFLGDALLATPPSIEPTAVLDACTRSRLAVPDAPVDPDIEHAIRAASGAEEETLANPAPLIETQRTYGLGGHYFYWRGLLRERDGRLAEADADFAFAAQCRVATHRGRDPRSPR